MSTSKVHAIDGISTTLLDFAAPALIVAAEGRVVSSGWYNAELSQYVYLVPPADDVQEFDFIAKRPPTGSPILPVLTPIRAEALLVGVDLPNYWGSGQPLRGIRIHAVANTKTALFDKTAKFGSMASPPRVYAPGEEPPPPAVPSFATDIKPLFRPRDINVMEALKGWRLDVYEDVKANAEKIRGQLESGLMPCDGAWPPADVELFVKWVEGGMPA
jgi:hypothetical protein